VASKASKTITHFFTSANSVVTDQLLGVVCANDEWMKKDWDSPTSFFVQGNETCFDYLFNKKKENLFHTNFIFGVDHRDGSSQVWVEGWEHEWWEFSLIHKKINVYKKGFFLLNMKLLFLGFMGFLLFIWAGSCKCISISMTLQKRQQITS
jgi:hypothetical protein